MCACDCVHVCVRQGECAHTCVTDVMVHSLLVSPVTSLLWQSIAGVTYQELVRIQSEWKLECKQRLQNGNFHESQQLTDLCNVRLHDHN